MKIDDFYNDYSRNYEKVIRLPLVDRFMINRDRAVFDFLPNSKDSVILDFGCGTGYYLMPLVKSAKKIVAIDASKGMIEVLRKRINKYRIKKIKTRIASIENFETKEKFDLILSIGVFNYLDDIELVLSKTYNLLKRGGTFIFTVPDRNNVFGWLYAMFWRIFNVKNKLYNKNDLVDALENTGFEVVGVKNDKNNFPTFHITIKAVK